MSEGVSWKKSLIGLSSTNGYPLFLTDVMANPFNIGIGCVVSSTAAAPSYNVEHTFDYTGSSTFTSTAATWFVNSGLSAKSTNQDGNYAYPVSAIRLNVTAGASQQTITINVIQAGA